MRGQRVAMMGESAVRSLQRGFEQATRSSFANSTIGMAFSGRRRADAPVDPAHPESRRRWRRWHAAAALNGAPTTPVRHRQDARPAGWIQLSHSAAELKEHRRDGEPRQAMSLRPHGETSLRRARPLDA